MRHITLGGDFDAHWVVRVVRRSAPVREESARDSTARSGAAVRAAHPSRVRSTRPRPSAAITTVQISRRRRWAAHAVTPKQGALADTDVRYAPRPPTPRDHRRTWITGLTTMAPQPPPTHTAKTRAARCTRPEVTTRERNSAPHESPPSAAPAHARSHRRRSTAPGSERSCRVALVEATNLAAGFR